MECLVTVPLCAIDPTVTAATITASVSLLVALISAGSSYVNGRKLKQLEREQAEDTAKIAYEYEARKRLYTVCEPLLFQAMEQAEDARLRIGSLARSAHQGRLRPNGSGWLGPGEVHAYYFKSTIYTLLAPITTFSILQRRLTTIDLSLDPGVREQYEMLKLVFFSFSKDWDLAEGIKAGPELPYDRNKTDPGERGRKKLLKREPERYAPQGLYRGMLDLVAEALVADAAAQTDESDDGFRRERCMTFGEFQRSWDRARAQQGRALRGRRAAEPPSPIEAILESMIELFCGFHPSRKPVLWRVLVTQYLLYGAFLNGKLTPLGEEEIQSLDWRTEGDAGTDFREPIRVGEAFVERELASVRGRL